MRVKLTITQTDEGEREVVLTDFPAVIGRNEVADVHLDDRYISRKHCEIYEIDGVPAVRDLNSKNGTYLNGSCIGESLLSPYDSICISPVRIGVYSEPAQETPEVTGSVLFSGRAKQVKEIQRKGSMA